MIYFDSAATSLQKPDCVADAVYHAIKNMTNSGRGVYESTLSASRVIFETRELLAGLFHADSPKNIVFTANSTASLNIALQGLLLKSDHVITTALEHNSVLRPLYRLSGTGMGLSVLPADKTGNIDYDDFEKYLRPNTRAVVCTHASNLTGNLLSLETIGDFCSRHGLLFIVDASQTAGVFPIDMRKQQIDVLCFTGHKGLLGPQGTGGLCVKTGVEIKPLMVGGSGVQSFSKTHPSALPAALEAGTLNGHGLAGLHAGINYIRQTGLDSIRRKESDLMWRFYHGVKTIPCVKIYGDFSVNERAPIVTLNIGDYDSGAVGDNLAQRYDICVRSGAHCAPLMHQTLGTAAQGAVRFSFSHFNTTEEIDKGIAAVYELATELPAVG
jgi:cysteine desulfurase family protein